MNADAKSPMIDYLWSLSPETTTMMRKIVVVVVAAVAPVAPRRDSSLERPVGIQQSSDN